MTSYYTFMQHKDVSFPHLHLLRKVKGVNLFRVACPSCRIALGKKGNDFETWYLYSYEVKFLFRVPDDG